MLFWFFNLLAGAGLLLAFLAAWISPAKIWWLALFGLGFGTLYLINFCFVIGWKLSGSRRYWFSLILLLPGLGKLFGIFQPPFGSGPPELSAGTPTLRVMSFNVRLFNLYNWFHNQETRAAIFRYLERTSPDIVCFQEYYQSDDPKENYHNTDSLYRILKAQSAHIEYTVTLRESHHWGIATFSKYPIVRQQAVHFRKKGGNIFLLTDIRIGNDTLRVFNTHLESIRFRWEDYQFIRNLGNDDVEQDEIAGGLNILRRLKRAFIKRADQVEVLHDSIMQSPYPVIVCGDFNDTPSSYSVRILSDRLLDAYRESGRGIGKTYSGLFPSFRIDYIFYDKRMKSWDYTTYRDEPLSDHYPISCRLALPKH
jgi:endonuclease/exonuclease/phosphatase family metal-dependent hydrolase